MKQQEQVENSLAQKDRRLWNRIWKLNIPPKVRNFVWEACSDILPTSKNLCRRRIPLNPTCAICQQHDETVAHALWGYPLARNVWALVKGKMQKRSSEVEDFYILVRELMRVLTTKESWRYGLLYLGLFRMHATGTCLTKNNLNLRTSCKERCHYCRNTRHFVSGGVQRGVAKCMFVN